jgi:hypothetical protein
VEESFEDVELHGFIPGFLTYGFTRIFKVFFITQRMELRNKINKMVDFLSKFLVSFPILGPRSEETA